MASKEVAIDGLRTGLQLAGEGAQVQWLLRCLRAAPSAPRRVGTARQPSGLRHRWRHSGMLPHQDVVSPSPSPRRGPGDLDVGQWMALLTKTADTGLAWSDSSCRSLARARCPVFLRHRGREGLIVHTEACIG